LDGEGKMKKLSIKPECVDPEDVEALEDLVVAAHNEAAKQLSSQQMNPDMLGGLGDLGALGDLGL
jgi:nucleoid-associated protein EbfC